MTWSRRHLLDVDDLSVGDLDLLLDLAAQARTGIDDGRAAPASLAGAAVALLFAEASTRTRLSFELAARRLGAQTFVLDPASSSLTKGESFVDTVRNLDAIGFGMLIVRHHRSGAAAVAARHFGGHVVNAGDGWHAHPTQALLDALTLRDELGSLAGRKIAIVGDIRHSRVARSNIHTLTLAGANVWLCGPRGWLAGLDQLAGALPTGRRLSLTDDLGAALDGADAVMGLRVQKERMTGAQLSIDEYVARYQITEHRLERARPAAVYLHPGPVNEGVEVTRAVALGPRSRVLEQVRNGVPTRMTALALLAGGGPIVPQTSSATRDLSSAIR